jgi:hypothetical protein
VLSYEIIFHGPPRRWAWLRADGLVATLLSAAALLYAAGKIFGHDSIAQMDAYRLHPSLSLYLDNNLVYLQSFFYGLFFDTRGWLIAIGISLFLLLSHPRPAIRWAAFYTLIATLPISFITARGGSSLLIPLFGWALLIPCLIASVWEPEWRFSRAASAASVAAFCLLAAAVTHREWQLKPAFFFRNEEKTWRVIKQVKGLHLQPNPGAKVLIVNDPWEHDYDMIFIAQLVWDDPSLQITLFSKAPESDPAKFDTVLEFTPDGALHLH